MKAIWLALLLAVIGCDSATISRQQQCYKVDLSFPGEDYVFETKYYNDKNQICGWVQRNPDGMWWAHIDYREGWYEESFSKYYALRDDATAAVEAECKAKYVNSKGDRP